MSCFRCACHTGGGPPRGSRGLLSSTSSSTSIFGLYTWEERDPVNPLAAQTISELGLNYLLYIDLLGHPWHPFLELLGE